MLKKRGYTVPIWLSNWVFKDKKGKIHKVDSQVVKGYNKGTIFTDQRIVKHTLVPVNLTLISQHGFGVEE